ncbi:MAG: hypothetical protein JSS20_12810 [Proteobacteria bacterium]|nr:hypothetical protein [Pseudomonadota bacterium]
MKLNLLTTADLKAITHFCEKRIQTELSNINQGIGNPIEEMERICRVMMAIRSFKPCDAVESDAAEAVEAPKAKRGKAA